MNIQALTPDELTQIKKKRSIRRMLAKKSHFWFFSIYLGHYMSYPFAPFHHEMFTITEDISLRLAVLVAFRGSGKSTLMSLSYPIWAVVGAQQKKFILIVSQTQAQARLHLSNIKKELETNELLKKDIGPFEEVSDEWGATSIVLSNFDARIAIASTEQSIRGIRHGQYRPDLVICDDVEDLNSVKFREGRDKTFQWLTGEVLPIGDQNTKIIIVGNLLHEDCLLMRLKTAIDSNKLQGKFLAIPLIREDDMILWVGKFPNMAAIEKLKATIGVESAWFREYLLKIISDADRLVHPDWIHYYDKIPPGMSNQFRYRATGMDLAIVEKESADFTSMVTADVYDHAEDLRVYILPNPINKRMGFPETVKTATELARTLKSKLYIEDVGYQKALIQHLSNVVNLSVEGFKPAGQDKRSRLALVTHLIQQGKVLFPRHGAEELVAQLTGFGIEKYDDLADAFSLLMLKIMEEDTGGLNVFVIETGSIYDFRRSGAISPLAFEPFTMDDKW